VRHTVGFLGNPLITVLLAKALTRVSLVGDLTGLLPVLVWGRSLIRWIGGIHVSNTSATIDRKLRKVIELGRLSQEGEEASVLAPVSFDLKLGRAFSPTGKDEGVKTSPCLVKLIPHLTHFRVFSGEQCLQLDFSLVVQLTGDGCLADLVLLGLNRSGKL